MLISAAIVDGLKDNFYAAVILIPARAEDEINIPIALSAFRDNTS